jgi:multidrug efflux pump subunit AcrB
VERFLRFFIDRHLLVNVLTLAVVVVGLTSASRMNVDGFPDAEMPRFIISAALPGASARDVETKVTIPIEEAIAEVDSLYTYYTVVTDNRSVTTVELDDAWHALT